MRSRSCRRFAPLVGRSLLAGLVLPMAAGCQHSRASGSAAPRAAILCSEQVNVGYGTLPRARVAGAVESRTAAELGRVPSGRLEEWLAGRFAALDVVQAPNGEYVLRIRGARSMLAGTEPLIVIDGIPSPLGLGSPLRDVSPHSVVRVDILKDASATAVYGARGANGVILITTRHARC
jgi:TonB-dependent starch-binding outer membrane protein SusC